MIQLLTIITSRLIVSIKMSPVATRAKRKESPSHQVCCLAPTTSGDGRVNTKKRRLVTHAPVASWQLSSDILHHVLGFFVSNDGVVDVETLLSTMLVSKQWNEVCTSSSFWSTTQESSESGDPIRNALYLMPDDFGSLQLEEEVPCLIGFTRVARLEGGLGGDGSVVFRAVERSSRRPCLLCISPKDQRSDTLLNHLYEANFFQGSFGFMEPQRKSVMMRREYPLGVGLWGGRVIRWYEDDVDSTSLSIMPPPVFSPKVSELALTRSENEPDLYEFYARCRLKFHYRHLQYLERSQKEVISDHLSTRSWAMIVDWLIEITMCFCLDSRVTFHAMDLLRRFLSQIEVSMSGTVFVLCRFMNEITCVILC